MASKINQTTNKNTSSVHLSKTVKLGKLVKVDLTLENNKTIQDIQDIQIIGDFFVHPEKKIDELERVLKGANIDDMSEIKKNVYSVLRSGDCQYYGFELDPLAELIHSFSLYADRHEI